MSGQFTFSLKLRLEAGDGGLGETFLSNSTFSCYLRWNTFLSYNLYLDVRLMSNTVVSWSQVTSPQRFMVRCNLIYSETLYEIQIGVEKKKKLPYFSKWIHMLVSGAVKQGHREVKENSQRRWQTNKHIIKKWEVRQVETSYFFVALVILQTHRPLIYVYILHIHVYIHIYEYVCILI